MEPNPIHRQAEAAIRALADQLSRKLDTAIESRLVEMQRDSNAHFLVYHALGVSTDEAARIDMYGNKGRYAWRYAGQFLEEAAFACFKARYPRAQKKVKIPSGRPSPKTFEVDCLIDHDAYEIKWRDATTDGDHVAKEVARVRAIAAGGFRPHRIVFFWPDRVQARGLQQRLVATYRAESWPIYVGDDAWGVILERTTVDLRGILGSIAREKQGTS